MHDNMCYEKPFLKQVIARIDFLAPVTILEKTLPPKLAKTFSQNFPIMEPVEKIAQHVDISESNVSHRQKTTKEWNFFGREREKQLVLTSECVFVTYSQYSNYEETKAHFSEVVDALKKAFPDIMAARFGLRYINEIEITKSDPTVWEGFFSDSLIVTRNFFDNHDQLTRLIQIAELKYGDMGLRFQFGMPNPDYPAVIRRPVFILDLDAHILSAHDLTESMSYMDDAHQHIQNLYEKSITDQLRGKMHVKSTNAI